MSQAPTPYDRQANFVTDASNNPLSGPSPTKLDKEFDAVEKALDQTQSRLAEIQRDDGALRNGIVTNDSLDPAIVFPGSRISQNSITSYHLADGSVGTNELVDNSVTTDKIPDGAITSAKIADGAVAIADIAGLSAELSSKQPAGSYVTTSDPRLTNSRTPTFHSSTHATGGVDALSPADIGAAQAVHTHVITNVTGLQSALDGKAATSHTHTISEVSGLQTALDGKQPAGSYASATHTHAIGDVSGLQSSLDSKADAVHTHTAGDVSGLAAVATSGLYDDLSGTPTLATVATTGNFSDLLGKPSTYPPSTHSHAISDVTGLQTALDGKQAAGSYAAASHTHTVSQITDFPALADVATTGSYNDLTDTPSYGPLALADDAPSDGAQYARKDGGWEAVSGGGGGGTAYDQSLNTTDDVAFNSVSIGDGAITLNPDGSASFANGAAAIGTDGKITSPIFQGQPGAAAGDGFPGGTAGYLLMNGGYANEYDNGDGTFNHDRPGNAGFINISGGAGYAEPGGDGGSLMMVGHGAAGHAGSIDTSGGYYTRGGNIITRGYGELSFNGDGGDINTSGGAQGPGGYINTSNGGGNLDMTHASINADGSASFANGAATIDSSGNITAANLPTTFFSGDYADLTGKPTLFSGAYADLTGKPTLFSGAYADLTGKPTFATVATSGSAADLTGTLADARLSANVPLLTAANTFTAAQTIASGTLTASAPALAITQTWNNSGITFAGMRVNVTDTASASNSLLLDLQVGGTSRFRVDKAGFLTTQQVSSTTTILTLAGSGGAFIDGGYNQRLNLYSDDIRLGVSSDVRLVKDGAANTLAQRNGTNLQVNRLYATFTDASNYVRLSKIAASDRFSFAVEAAGTGTARPLEISAHSASSDPTTSSVTSGRYGVWKNSTSGEVRLWYNDAGTMKSATMTTTGGGGGGATGGGTDTVFYNNGQTVTTNYTIPTGQNSGSFGPITIASGVTVTVPDGSTYTVV